jgi:hypothetical protein
LVAASNSPVGSRPKDSWNFLQKNFFVEKNLADFKASRSAKSSSFSACGVELIEFREILGGGQYP